MPGLFDRLIPLLMTVLCALPSAAYAAAIEIREQRVWVQLNLAWVGFFVVAGVANMIVAPEIDPLGLQFSEDTWVDFKLFGLMGMTIAFVIAQAFYLARYMPKTDEETN